jgi:hypothetical protein
LRFGADDLPRAYTKIRVFIDRVMIFECHQCERTLEHSDVPKGALNNKLPNYCLLFGSIS